MLVASSSPPYGSTWSDGTYTEEDGLNKMASNPQPEPQPSPPSPRPPFWRNFRYYLHAQSHKLMIAVSLLTLAGVGRLVYLRSGKNKNKRSNCEWAEK